MDWRRGLTRVALIVLIPWLSVWAYIGFDNAQTEAFYQRMGEEWQRNTQLWLERYPGEDIDPGLIEEVRSSFDSRDAARAWVRRSWVFGLGGPIGLLAAAAAALWVRRGFQPRPRGGQDDPRSTAPTLANEQPKSQVPETNPAPVSRRLSIYTALAAVSAAVGGLIWWASSLPPPPGPKPYQQSPPAATAGPPPAVLAWERPATAPNGKPWPNNAGYVPGYPKLNLGGLSSVTVDNAQNDADVFVKLVSISGEKAFPIRQFFIPSHSSFAVKDVEPGKYDVRYRDLSTGALARSEGFDLQETRDETGTRFSNLTMTLYKVADGNMTTYPLAQEEF